MCEKYYISNPSGCICKNCKYLESIIDDLVITCDKTIEATKTVPMKAIVTKTISIKTIPTNVNKKSNL